MAGIFPQGGQFANFDIQLGWWRVLVMMVTCDGSSDCMLSVQSASKEPEGTLKTVYLPKLLSQSCLICACDLQIFRVSSRQT